MRPEDFSPTDFQLAEHGDTRQRTWAAEILPHWPHLESFWQKHVVPLSFRVIDPANYFLRPSLDEELIDLADAEYAVFFHLAQMHEWRRHMARTPDAKGIGATEALYCFFSHGASLVDATLGFADCIDRVCFRHGVPVCFELELDEHGHPRRLGDNWGMAGDRHRWGSLLALVRDTRNFLVHRRPVFLQNRYMPRPEYLDAMSGLTAITRVARDHGLLRERYTEVLPTLEDILREAARTLDGVWVAAEHALDSITRERYVNGRFAVRKGDARLTLEEIRRVRTLE